MLFNSIIMIQVTLSLIKPFNIFYATVKMNMIVFTMSSIIAAFPLRRILW